MVLPQLDTTTYYSQLFWLVVNLAVVYLFVSKIFVPSMRSRLKRRLEFIDNLLSETSEAQSSITMLKDQITQTLIETEKQSNALKEQMLLEVEQHHQLQQLQLKEQFAELKAQSASSTAELISAINKNQRSLVIHSANIIMAQLIGAGVDNSGGENKIISS